MNRNTTIGIVTLVLLMLLAAWQWGWFKREDPVVAEIREIAAQPQNDDSAKAMRNAMRERMEGASEEQRMAMFEQLAPIFIPMMAARFEADYDKFMAMTPEAQKAELDKRIDDVQKRMAKGGGPGGGGGGGGGGPRNMDPKKMGEFQKKMLAWTTPSQRAKWDNGIQIFTNRMKERGLTPPPMPGGGFF
jgi:hypothetical protein